MDAEVRITLAEEPPLLPPGRPRSAAPVALAARAWVRALATGSGAVTGADADALAELGRRVTRWHRSAPWPTAPLRLGFRLEEPLGPSPTDAMGWTTDEHWTIAITAQAVAEPALTVDAGRVWVGGPALAALERTVPAVEETFLAEFERAVRCWPPLGEALRNGRPERVTIDRAQALAFLAEGAGALADAGFEVRLPAWWRRSARLGLHLLAGGTGAGADPGLVQTSPLLDRDVVVDVPLAGAPSARAPSPRRSWTELARGEGPAGPAARPLGLSGRGTGSPPGWRSCAAAAAR